MFWVSIVEWRSRVPRPRFGAGPRKIRLNRSASNHLRHVVSKLSRMWKHLVLSKCKLYAKIWMCIRSCNLLETKLVRGVTKTSVLTVVCGFVNKNTSLTLDLEIFVTFYDICDRLILMGAEKLTRSILQKSIPFNIQAFSGPMCINTTLKNMGSAFEVHHNTFAEYEF